jgi:hypothetical protein
MNDRNTTLANLLADIDCLPIRYLRDRVIFKKRGVEMQFHPGTHVPCRIDGVHSASELLYVEQWVCCGEYQCSSGVDGVKRKTKQRCSAVMRIRVLAGARAGQYVVQIRQDTAIAHGESFVMPDVAVRYDWRSKAILAQAIERGVTELSDVYTEELWPARRIPRPATKAEKHSMRRRWLNQVKKSRVRARVQDDDDESESDVANDEEMAVDDDGGEDEDDDDDEPVIEKILDMKKDPMTRASFALVKWRYWPERAATWERTARIPQNVRRELMNAFRNSAAARDEESVDNRAEEGGAARVRPLSLPRQKIYT